jgi:ABC-2 type transport system permease protein
VKKLLVIAWKEMTLRFTDPLMLAFALGMPLVLAALIDLSFADLVLSRGIADKSIPVGIVNQDRGGAWGNFGELFVSALSRPPDASTPTEGLPFELFSVHRIADEVQARQMVEREELMAALLVPPDFSEAVEAERATVTVYVNGADSVRGVAFKSVVETLSNMITAGEVAVRTTVTAFRGYSRTRAELEAGRLDKVMEDLALAAARPASNPIKIQVIKQSAPSTAIQLTRYLAAAITILFAGFAGLVGSAALLQEKAQGTLQRMYITPTRSGIILGGNALGTYLCGLVQMCVLAAGMVALEILMSNGPGRGSRLDLGGLLILILALVGAATGLGLTVAGLARTSAQAVNYGGASLLLMGLIGGIFFPVELFPTPFDVLSRLTFHYWAMDGYLQLALGNSALSILPHTIVLAVMGAGFFVAGNCLLRRRIEFT